MTHFLAGHVAPASRYVCRQCVRKGLAVGAMRRAFHISSTRCQREQNVLSLLEQRGYVNQIAGDRDTLEHLLRSKSVGFYTGIDPTAPSLHLGHLLPLMVLFWLYHHGHIVVTLVGGGTARVGDPSGRLTSRAKTAGAVHDANILSMTAQIGRIWENAVRYGRRHGYNGHQAGRRELLNNATWLDKLNLLGFLKMLGSGMRLGTMLGRDTVRNKMEKGDGMSFSEFTYPLLQAWDWWHMYSTKDIQVQIGGSDQYGNITAGMDAVKYVAQSRDQSQWHDGEGNLRVDLLPMGMTVPLLTTSSGEKFGKSAGNAIWLDSGMMSSFDLYGFLLRTADEDVERYLKLFTFVPMPEIVTLMADHMEDPGKRKAQHLLASEVLEIVHGEAEAERTRMEHQALRNPSLASLSRTPDAGDASTASSSATGNERLVLPTSLVVSTPFSRILYHAGVVKSKSEGARSIAKGGVYVATRKPNNGGTSLYYEQIAYHKTEDVRRYIMDVMLVLRIGKWKVRVVEVIEDTDFEGRKLDAPGWREWKANRSSA